MKGRWTDWYNYIRTAREALELGPPPDFGHSPSDAAAEMRRAEKRARAKIDQICLGWIETGKWPVMTVRDRGFASQRFLAALLLLFALISPGRGNYRLAPTRGTKRSDLLRWFLVDTWPFNGPRVLGCDATLPPKTPSASIRSLN